MPKISLLFQWIVTLPRPSEDGAAIPLPERKHEEEPDTLYESFAEAHLRAEREVMRIHRENNGCPASVTMTCVQFREVAGTRAKSVRTETITLEAREGWQDRPDVQPAPPKDEQDRMQEAITLLGEGRPVRFCIGCGSVGPDATVCLCRECQGIATPAQIANIKLIWNNNGRRPCDRWRAAVMVVARKAKGRTYSKEGGDYVA